VTVTTQEQVVAALTTKEPLAEPEAKEFVLGDNVYEHGEAIWLTTKVCPPTVIVPLRATVLPF